MAPNTGLLTTVAKDKSASTSIYAKFSGLESEWLMTLSALRVSCEALAEQEHCTLLQLIDRLLIQTPCRCIYSRACNSRKLRNRLPSARLSCCPDGHGRDAGCHLCRQSNIRQRLLLWCARQCRNASNAVALAHIGVPLSFQVTGIRATAGVTSKLTQPSDHGFMTQASHLFTALARPIRRA